jgi:tRNA pseudouridine13 synthase
VSAPPAASAVPVLRSVPEDFVVDEIPLYPPSGEGGHTFVWVEKRFRTTEEIARALARAGDVAPRDVGYAGRKDRVAVTRQWFSVPGLAPERALELELPGARVLEARRHGHKLRTGQLRGNRFEIVVRNVDAALAARAAKRLAEGLRRGFPNRFGEQRFGRDGANASAGLAALRGETVRGAPRSDRRALRFLVSALQSAVFNEALRLRDVPLDGLEDGDVAMVLASGGLFLVEDAVVEGPRAAAGEVSATGPMFGTRTLDPRGRPAERERQALRQAGLDPDVPLPALPGLRLRGTRRALRMLPSEADQAFEAEALRLRFTLPPGGYASVLLEEVIGTSAPIGVSPQVT